MLSDSGVMLLGKWSVFELYLTAALWFVIHSLKDKIFYGYLRIFDLVLKKTKKGEGCVASRPGSGGSVSLPYCSTAPEQDAKSKTAPEPGFSFCDWVPTSPRNIAQFYFYFVIEGEVKANTSQILGDITFFFCVWSDATSPLRRLLGWAWVEPLLVLQGQVRLQTKKIFEFVALVTDFSTALKLFDFADIYTMYHQGRQRP